MIQKITPHLWFDSQAEEAAEFYASIFKDSKILNVSRYTEAGQEVHGQKPGTAMTVEFELEGQRFIALNGGPLFKFNESISFLVSCETQDEIDDLFGKLSAVPESEQCGWLKDKFGLSWQIVPSMLGNLFSDADKEKSGRAMNAMLKMKKLNIAELKAAFNGE